MDSLFLALHRRFGSSTKLCEQKMIWLFELANRGSRGGPRVFDVREKIAKKKGRDHPVLGTIM